MSHTTHRPPSPYRSSIIFLTGLIAAAGTAVWFDSSAIYLVARRGAAQSAALVSPQMRLPAPLDAGDMDAARIAWSYLAQNVSPTTGLAATVTGSNGTTIWDQASYLLGLVAASELKLVAPDDFAQRVERLGDGLAALPLLSPGLPNKAYDIGTGKMTDYKGEEALAGIGWSALDIARMMSAMLVLERHAPDLSARLQKKLSHWNFCKIAAEGELVGGTIENGTVTEVQEGRIGYEQYAARAASQWGCDAMLAANAEAITAWHRLYGIDVPSDRRTPSSFDAIAPTSSEPFILSMLEMGGSREMDMLAAQVYAAQEARYKTDGIVTAVSEDHLDREPYFLYSAVWNGTTPWAVVDDKGNPFEQFRTFSTKTAFGWSVIYDTPYAGKLRDTVKSLAAPGKGWYAGRFEATGEVNAALALNTNAIVLEALHYKALGPLLTAR